MKPIPISDDLSLLSPLDQRRVRMTVSCRDSDAIPKVPDAGKCFEGPAGPFQVMHNGQRVVLGSYCGSWMTQIIHRLKGHHEPQEERAFYQVLEHLPPRATMFEAGAWWGYYSLWFNARIPGARNVLIEPNADYLEVGKANFALNGRSAEFLWCSLGASSKPSLSQSGECNRPARTCSQTCIDDLLREKGIDYLDLLHADIQGAELALLHGARTSIRQGKIRFIFLSTHHLCISGDPLIHQKCGDFLREYGAHILIQHSVEEGFSGDGMIVASFHPADRELGRIPISFNCGSHSLFGASPLDHAEALQYLAQAREQLKDKDKELTQRNWELAELTNRLEDVFHSRWYRWTIIPRVTVCWLRRRLLRWLGRKLRVTHASL